MCVAKVSAYVSFLCHLCNAIFKLKANNLVFDVFLFFKVILCLFCLSFVRTLFSLRCVKVNHSFKALSRSIFFEFGYCSIFVYI